MEHIAHVLGFGVIVCKECKYAVLPSHIEAHFKPTRPHGFTRAEQQRIADAVAQMEGLVQDEKALQDGEFQFLADTAPPIEVLGGPQAGGLRCTLAGSRSDGSLAQCAYVSRTAKRMAEHCRQAHG